MKNKNKELLEDFAKYCEAHPELRFWQALRNWSGINFIVAARESLSGLLEDTYYWEGKDK